MQLRNELVERYRPDVEEIARRLHQRLPRRVDPQDLALAGIQGLIHAIERFDQRRGRDFSAFMAVRVRGSMLDELRACDWLPRSLRELMTRREAAILRLRGELGHEPSDQDVALRLSMRMEEYQSTFGGPPSDQWPGGEEGAPEPFESMTDPDQESPLEGLYRREILARVQSLLSPVERRLVKLHYFDGLKLGEVARKLKRSPSRICQLHGRVLARLKTKLMAESVAV